MTRKVWSIALALALALAAGCAPAPVEVDLAFPSADAARYGDRARLYAFPLGSEELGDCPTLLDEVVSGRPTLSIDPAYESGLIRVCSFQGLALPALSGPHAWLAEVRGTGEDILFAGCTVAEIVPGAAPIRIDLGPTENLDPASLPTGSAHECIGEAAP